MTFPAFRNHPSGKFTPYPEFFARVLNLVSLENDQLLFLLNLLFWSSCSGTLRIQSHLYSPGPCQYSLSLAASSGCSSFLTLSGTARLGPVMLWPTSSERPDSQEAWRWQILRQHYLFYWAGWGGLCVIFKWEESAFVGRVGYFCSLRWLRVFGYLRFWRVFFFF